LTALHATYSLSKPDVSITQNEVNLMRGMRMGFQDFFASLGKAELFGEKRHAAEWQSACDLAPRGAVGHFTREDFDAAIIPKMDEDSYVAAWLRQSVMHAVGHVLGLGHRYDASTRGAYSNQESHRKRTVPPSVMDEFPLSMILFQLQHVDIAKEDKLSLEVLTGGPPADVPLCVASHFCVPGDFGTDPVTDYRGRYMSHLRAITADSSPTDINVVAHLDQLAMIVDDLMRAGFPATPSMQTWLIELLDESASRALVPSKDAAMVQVAVRLPWFGLLSSLQQGLISGAVKTRLAKDLVDAGQLPSSVRRAFFRSLVVYGVKSRRAFAEVAEVFEAAGIDLLAKNPISVMITLNDPKAVDREDPPAVLSRTQEWMQAHLKNCGSFAGVKADREFCLDDWNQLEELLDLWEKAKRTVP
jgi:hypothetical protein